MSNAFFYAAVFGFTAGIFSRSFFDFGSSFSVFLLLLAAALAALSFRGQFTRHLARPVCACPRVSARRRASEGRVERIAGLMPYGQGVSLAQTSGAIRGLLVSAFIFAAALGVFRFAWSEDDSARDALSSYRGQSITLEGVVSDEPDVRETNTHLTVSIDSARTGKDSFEKVQTKIIIFADKEPAFTYGDRIRIEGAVAVPERFMDERTLHEVDYPAYLAKNGIYYSMFRPHITLVSSGEGNALVSALFRVKRAFMARVGALLPEPHASLLNGLVVGAKQSLGEKLLEDFRTTGIIHIVVLSGYNITIIGYFIEWLVSRLRRNVRLALSALAMILFAVLVGASATVVRATLMALLVIIARSTGRIYAVTRALLIAGTVMLLHNPKILVFDISFQLSFIATLGLIYVSPLIEPHVGWITATWKLREVAVATLATQAFVLPFLLYKMGILSLVALPVNLLVLAAIPATMLFGFLTGIAGFVSSALAAPFAILSYMLLWYELLVVEWFAALPFAAVTVTSFPLWLALVWYAIYAVVLFVWYRKQSTGQREEYTVA